jgi:hypothetical protein
LIPFSNRLEIKIFNKGKTESEENFVYFNFIKTSITIGRDIKCDISFIGDKTFSRVQCTIFLDKDLNLWRIIDGSNKMPSTNGTW